MRSRPGPQFDPVVVTRVTLHDLLVSVIAIFGNYVEYGE